MRLAIAEDSAGEGLGKAIVETYLVSNFDPNGASAANVTAISQLDEHKSD
jgi:ribose 5-phosphate isomerase RpiB